MSETKIQIKVGHVEFSGEGNPDWLSTQLDKILEKVPDLLKIELSTPSDSEDVLKNKSNNTTRNQSQNIPSNLSIFLKERSATTIQTRKFLATAAYLQLNGKKTVTTSEVNRAIKDNQQSKLNNPSQNLADNIKQGFCTKDLGKDFYVTPEGFKELGLDS